MHSAGPQILEGVGQGETQGRIPGGVGQRGSQGGVLHHLVGQVGLVGSVNGPVRWVFLDFQGFLLLRTWEHCFPIVIEPSSIVLGRVILKKRLTSSQVLSKVKMAVTGELLYTSCSMQY